MCGRFVNQVPPEILARLFGTVNPLPNLKPSFNIAPRQDAAAVRRHPQTGALHLDLLNWGLLPHFTKDAKAAPRPINARAETLASNGLFRGAFVSRRCIIPADAFYEWQTIPGGTPSRPNKQPWAIARADGATLAFAGLWEGWRAPDGGILRSFAIVTTVANEAMTRFHDRMPVILERPDWPAWLGETPAPPAPLLRPAAAGTLRFWQVSPAVNSVRNDASALLNAV
jgi:putative SOS response-associated peptidase YedK